MAKTLEELKAENAAAEAEAAEETAAEVEQPEVEASEEETEETAKAAEPEQEEAEETELEGWQLEDEQASDSGDEPRFTSSDVAAAKRKLRARLEKRDDELAQVKAELERLKNGQAAPAAQKQATPMPTLEAHDYDEAKYAAALQEWMLSQVNNVTKSHQETEQQKRQKAEQQRQLESAVESHYERAAKLAQEYNIDADLYQSADRAVRQTVESVFPGQGDEFTDSLIARMGEGSEKVAYSLGRSASKRETLAAKLREDPSGLSAMVYLGELKSQVTQPVKKVTQAPKPAARAEGGDSGSTSADKLMKKYRSEPDIQKRFDMKRDAKRNGIDVSNW